MLNKVYINYVAYIRQVTPLEVWLHTAVGCILHGSIKTGIGVDGAAVPVPLTNSPCINKIKM